MNVLILTPDSVGSTLLQRLLTIYMQFHDFDQPVINLHELTRGLRRYYSPEFNREMVGMIKDPNDKCYQTLGEISTMLGSVDHYKTCRLAQYHIRRRGDPMSEQAPFYQYLNDNFFIISCRRDNLFEHALGWAINGVTKKLNVYTHQDKIQSFFDLYRNPVTVDADGLRTQLDKYRRYTDWCSEHFVVNSYFHYDRDLPRIEDYILDLPVFCSQTKRHTWQSIYGQDFADWNRCHYMVSNVGGLAASTPTALLEHTDSTTGTAVTVPTKKSIINSMSTSEREYLAHHAPKYMQATQSIEQMERLGIVSSGIPIKKQTLRDKQLSVKNFDQCLDTYNEWINNNPGLSTELTHQQINNQIELEQQHWQGQLKLTKTSDSVTPSNMRIKLPVL
jgi:hypothetical protein